MAGDPGGESDDGGGWLPARRPAVIGASRPVPNIGEGERRRRLRSGLVSIGAGLLLAIVLMSSDVAWWWRLLVFLPFWAGVLGVFQYREHT